MLNVNQMKGLIVFGIIFFVLIQSFSVKADPDIMQCFLCKIITEDNVDSSNPTALYTSMYKKCGQLGLIQLICDNLVEKYAKSIVRLRRSKAHFSQQDICLKLRLCDY